MSTSNNQNQAKSQATAKKSQPRKKKPTQRKQPAKQKLATMKPTRCPHCGKKLIKIGPDTWKCLACKK